MVFGCTTFLQSFQNKIRVMGVGVSGIRIMGFGIIWLILRLRSWVLVSFDMFLGLGSWVLVSFNMFLGLGS